MAHRQDSMLAWKQMLKWLCQHILWLAFCIQTSHRCGFPMTDECDNVSAKLALSSDCMPSLWRGSQWNRYLFGANHPNQCPTTSCLLVPLTVLQSAAVLCKTMGPGIVGAPSACPWVPSALGTPGKTDEKTKAGSHAMPLFRRAARIQILGFPKGLGRGTCGGPKLHPQFHPHFSTRILVFQHGRHSCPC